VKTTSQFVIRGHKDELDDKYLYWSNKDGWVHFDTATRFKKNEYGKITLPLGSTGITWIKSAKDNNMAAKKNSLKKDLLTAIRKQEKKEGTDILGAFRDALTDMRHIAEDENIDFDLLTASALEVYKEEKALEGK
jgi:hypothetical protein